MNINQNDYNILKQSYMTRYLKINILNFQYQIVDEISGNLIDCTFSSNANSDMRNSCDVTLVINDDSFNIQSGGKIWLDKYIQVYIGILNIFTDEIQWYNQGIYLIDNPTWNYDATTNQLRFTALDLMSKLTGIRNGYLEGLPTIIKQGANVREAIIATLTLGGFTKYVISECLDADGIVQNVPNDIQINQGGTIYDILKSLRDILPNYEIFFDNDGVFRYQLIPSGENEPILVTDDILKPLLISEEISTDFESVKNYIEVYGRSHDIKHYSSTTTFSGNILTLTIASLPSSLVEFIEIGFTTPNVASITGNLQLSVNSFGAKNLVGGNGKNIVSLMPNTYYVASYQSNGTWLFLGHLQAQAFAQDNNVDSPFYVNGPVGQIRAVKFGNEYDNIQSDELAQQRANLEIYWACRLKDSIILTCIPNPWLTVNTLISHVIKDGTEPTTYMIKSISTNYSETGTQTINAITYYPYTSIL